MSFAPIMTTAVRTRQITLLCALTSDARMEPPIQALNRRSTVVLLAISFSLMLCKSQIWKNMEEYLCCVQCLFQMMMMTFFLKFQSIVNLRSHLINRTYEGKVAVTHRRGFLGELSVQTVCEALDKRVSSGHHHTAIQALSHKSKRPQKQVFVIGKY